MRSVDLLVVGDCNPDLILVGCDRPPAFGQTEQLVRDGVLTIGGSAAIVACGAARLGLRTAIVGSVGDDVFGHFMLSALQERDVDVSACKVGVARTGVTVVLDRGDDRAQLTAPGAIGELSAGDVAPDLLEAARHVHVSSYFLQPALQPGMPQLLQRARTAGATTSLDTNWDPAETWGAGLRAALPHLDVFLPNRAEAALVSGETDPERAAAAIAAAGPATVVVKLGPEGAIAFGGGRLARSGSVPVDAVDATGAGDSFAAGFIAGLLGDRPLEDTLALACACGALSTRGVGGTSAQPTMDEALTEVATLHQSA